MELETGTSLDDLKFWDRAGNLEKKVLGISQKVLKLWECKGWPRYEVGRGRLQAACKPVWKKVVSAPCLSSSRLRRL